MTQPPLCLLVQPIHPDGVARLVAGGLEVEAAPDTSLASLAPLLARAEAVITRNFGLPPEALALAPRLKVIGSHGTGTDRIDLAGAALRGIAVLNTPGANARSVAEHALALILAVARGLPEADRRSRNGDFNWRLQPEAQGLELHGRCLGLWGFGHTARHLARMAQGLGMRVLVLSAHADPADLMGYERAPDAANLLAQSDVLSLHALPGPEPLIGARELAALRQGAILVNTARGALIDELALIAALERSHLRGAALDVFTEEPLPASSPLTRAPRLLLTPHLAASTEAAARATALAVAEAVLAHLPKPDGVPDERCRSSV